MACFSLLKSLRISQIPQDAEIAELAPFPTQIYNLVVLRNPLDVSISVSYIFRKSTDKRGRECATIG